MPPLLDHNESFILKRFAEGWKITGQSWRRGSIIETLILQDQHRVDSLHKKGMVAITSGEGCKPVCYEITEEGREVLIS